MEVVNSEKFLYFNKCEVSFEVKSSRRIEKLSSNFLFTINSIYFFLDSSDYKNKKLYEETEMMERNLICKLNHDKIYIINYDDITRSITFSHRFEDCQIIMNIKDMQQKEFKDFVNICLIFDGYKIMLEDMDIDYSSYQDYLQYITENIMSNGGCLVVESEFFSIDGLYLSNFVCFLSRLEKITFKVNVKNVQILHMMKTVFCELYDENYNIVDIKKTDLFQPKFSLLKVLKLVDNKLNDDGLDNLSSILDQTVFLSELEISKNHITCQSLIEISKRFPNKLKNLEKMNFSYNWIDSYMLEEFMKVALEGLPKLNLIDLTGNYIDNEFLRKLDITYLRKVYNKINFNEIVIDLSKNNFDNHIMQKNFYLWKIEEESEKVDRGIYTVENFLQNLYTFKINLKFKFELVRHFKETKEFEVYKKSLEEGKSVKISCKTINCGENIIKSQNKSENTEIQNYIELLKLFYLIDQFFDPNLNNFNNKDINMNIDIESGFLCNANLNHHYIQLEQAIMNIMNSQLLTNNVNQMIHFLVTNNINMILTHEFYKNNRNDIIQQIIGKSSENFTPNFSIEDFYSIFNVIKSHSIEIPLIPLQKYINRAKIDTMLTIKEKDIDSLIYLNEINNYLDTSYTEKVVTVLNSLKEKAYIINEGLISVMNFEGYANESNMKLFYKEVNNYLDIFIKEAISINLKNDLVSLAKYIQFVRNNKIRAELYEMYQNILKEENLFYTAGKILAEFDVMYNKYRTITDFTKLRIPIEIKVKILSLHPKRLDYLELCEATLADLEHDLKVISEKLNEEESYGRRNIHDRIHFLLAYTSDPVVDENNRYKLHKQNNFLKHGRILFRYFNNLDISAFNEDFYLEYVVIQDIKDYFKEEQNDEEIPQKKELNSADKNSMINYFKLKSMSDRERVRKVERTALEILEYKKKILTFDSNPLRESLINPSNDLSKEWENQFNSIAVQLNEKLYHIFDRNFYEDNNTIISMPQICKGIKEYVEFYLELKDRYQKDNFRLYDLINQEIVLQLYRHINRDDFSEQNKIVRYGLGLFTIMTFYLDLNSVLITALRKWTNYLISRGNFVEYCKNIQNNFLNFSNKKIFWVPSIFEIEHRLENIQIMLKVNFGGSYYEDFEIQEKTTISDLYEKILKESMFFRDIPEKRLYWIFINYFHENDMMPVFNEEYVLDLISFLESNAMIEFESWEKKYDNYTSNSYDKNYEDDDDMAERRYMFDQDVVRKPEPFVFYKIQFKIQRRLYSPFILSSEFSQYNENELQLLYEQIKYIFIKKELSILLADGDTVSVCAILIEELKRNTYVDSTTTLDEFIASNLHKVMPEFKKNIINYKHDNFITQVEAMITEKNYSTQTDRELKEEFLRCFKNYGIFFSNIYDIRLKSTHSTYKINMFMPQKFFLLVSLDVIIFLDSNRFEIILKFNYEDIIYCTYICDILYIAITIKNEKGVFNELRFRLRSDDARVIMEDILSYSQLYLARKTQSQYTNCKVHEFLDEAVVCDIKDYKLVFQRKLPHMKNIPSISNEMLEIQKKVAHTKFMRNSFILKNPNFFKRDSTEVKRIPSSQRFLFKKDFSIAKLKIKYDDPLAYDEDKSDISILRDQELDKKDYKIDISNRNYNTSNNISQRMITSQNKNVIVTAENVRDQTVNENEVMEYESDNYNEEVNPSDNVAIKTSKKLDQAMKMLPFKFLLQDNPEENDNNEEDNY